MSIEIKCNGCWTTTQNTKGGADRLAIEGECLIPLEDHDEGVYLQGKFHWCLKCADIAFRAVARRNS